MPRKKARDEPFWRNFLASPQVRIHIGRIVPVDVELVVVPTRVRHAAIGITRTSAESDILDVQVLARFQEILELVEHTLRQSHAFGLLFLEVVGREIF